MSLRYIGLKTDMIRSRTLGERNKVQELFLTAADRMNAEFHLCFESGFIVTHGDEAQALIKIESVDSVYQMIEALVEMMEPIELRFGLGCGTLNTKVQEMAIGMDGEVWQNAKKAIDIARRSHQIVCLRGFHPEEEQALEALANLLLFLHKHWTSEQLEVIRIIRTGQAQAAIARMLKVSEAAISKRLSAAGWRQYEDGRDAFQKFWAKAILMQEG